LTLEIRTFGDPVLKSTAAPVDTFDESLSRLAADMLETMHDHEGVGLAANQVGRLKRILVAALEDEEIVIVNPVVKDQAEETEKDMEGCLSIPEVQVEVERPVAVTVTGQDLAGNQISIEARDLMARILQHETDHLNGILILDRTDRDTRRAAMREFRTRLMTQ
jgi:peptide deformylase